MLQFYQNIFYRLEESLRKSGNLDPLFSAIMIISIFWGFFLFQILILIEMFLKQRILIGPEIYLPVAVIIFIANWIYFIFNNKLDPDKKSRIEKTNSILKGWKVFGLMFISFLVIVILVLLRIKYIGS